MRPAFIALFLSCTQAVGALSGADWQTGTGFRSGALSVPATGKAGFTLLPAGQTGVSFTNVLSQERSLTNQIYLNGSGVALGDVDGDGWCDIYLCGLDNGNALYRNRGNLAFEDITARTGVACADQASTGAAFADLDGDGDLDLIVGGILRGARLFLNEGGGRFRESTHEAGISSRMGTTSLALADVNGDGWLDLYVVNYRSRTLRDEPDTRFKVSTAQGQFKLLAVDNQPVTHPELQGRFTVDPVTGILENGEPDVLYLNQGQGRFRPASWTDGTFLNERGQPAGVLYDWGLSAMFHDLNRDGAPDLYVCNDFHPEDRIWINTGSGQFRPIPARSLRHISLFSMGVDFADIDGDGHDEIFVADMLSRSHVRRQVQVSDRMILPGAVGAIQDRPQYSRNMLFWNRGDGSYAEIAQLSGVEAADWCWCPVFLDVDLDGYQDLLMVTGHERDAQNIDLSRQIETAIKQRPGMSRTAQMQLRKIFPVYDTPNFAFRNRGDLTFEETGRAWGFDSTQVSQGIALADLDNDGDMDVVINCLNGPALLYRNDSAAPRLAVRLRGAPPNGQGIGARIRVSGPGLPEQSREVTAGGRYLAGDDPVASFAGGSPTNRLRIEVLWRDGRRSLVAGAEPDRLYEIDQAQAVAVTNNPTPSAAPWFEDASGALQHQHVETAWDDFQHQPLLPRRFSQGGPGLTWFDLNDDGWEDLIVGSGRGGSLAVFTNNTRGGFALLRERPFSTPVTRDQTTVIGYRLSGAAALLAGSANYEDGLAQGPVVRIYEASRPIGDSWPGQRASTGPLALGAVDAGGSLALFVGGQVVRGRYPEPASSLIFRPEGREWRLDAAASKVFSGLGIVNGAVWSDLDSDGAPELVLACEWGPLRVFRRTGAAWAEVAQPEGIAGKTGWWQSVSAGDFDGDGKMDLVAGNWGRNSKYQAFLAGGLRLYAGDLHGDGAWELIEAYLDPELNKVVPWGHWESLARTMPFLRERYHSFTQFSTASVSDILDSRQKQVALWTANTLDSMVFLNRGDRWEARSLPVEAQLSPVFGLVVADFNGDGREDLFLNQNFFALPPNTSRADAGCGTLLWGDGRGGFESVPSAQTGIQVDGEGRGAAVCDYDHDGRPDLAVGQNANATLLYRNRRGHPGLRVLPRGPASNPAGIGAQLRLEDAGGALGPTREVHAGSGYWSQDGAVQVLGVPTEPRFLHVLWPGGKRTRSPVARGAAEMTVAIE